MRHGTSPRRLSRRDLLGGTAAAAATALLAACGGGVTAPTIPSPTVATPSPPTATAIPQATATTAPLATVQPIPTATRAVSATAIAASAPNPTVAVASVSQGTAAVPTASAPPLTRVLRIDGGREQLRDANAVAVGPDGNVYIGEYISGNSVKVFAPDGTFLRKWGKRGSGNGEFSGITGIALDTAGNVYVADFSNIRLQVFANDGTFLRQIPTEAPIGPAGIALDKDGNIYIANHRTHDHYVQKFASDGTSLLTWGGNGTGNGEFIADTGSGPGAVTVDGAGNVYVNDPNNSRIEKFDMSGNWLATIGSKGERDDQFGTNNPGGLAVDRAGNLYTNDRGNIVKFDPSGRLVARWAGTAGSSTGTFAATGFLNVDDQGNIYIINRLDDTILKFRQAEPG